MRQVRWSFRPRKLPNPVRRPSIMGGMAQVITVQIQTEQGTLEAGPILWERPPLPGVDDTRFACLRFVDPYGDTVFNQLQIPVVLQDLRLLATTPLGKDQLSQIRGIEARIEAYVQNPHFYLRFIGD